MLCRSSEAYFPETAWGRIFKTSLIRGTSLALVIRGCAIFMSAFFFVPVDLSPYIDQY